VYNTNFDFSSGVTARDSGDRNKYFLQLISDSIEDSTKISVFTDGSRTCSKDGSCVVRCAVVVPCLKVKFMYKLNNFFSSYTVEAIAILKAMDLALSKR